MRWCSGRSSRSGHGRIADLRAEARSSLRFRKRTQPLDAPSAGCAFRNPEPGRHDAAGRRAVRGRSAGRWRRAEGMRAVGGARVSGVHANFIVTDPGARARDVRVLIDRCRADVAAKYGVTLAPEVVFLGEFDASP